MLSNEKMIKKSSTYILLISIIFVALSQQKCANISPPSGGKKDTIKPKIVRQYPQNYSTEFLGKKIKLVFSEPVSNKEIKQNLIINPVVSKIKVSSPKLNEVEIEFDTLLRENTTYVIDFNNGIFDLTEKNILVDKKLIFSTGKKIDSSTVRGIVRNKLTNNPIQQARVMLFEENDTILKNPIYKVSSNDMGQFEITNVNRQKYLVVASNENKQKFNLYADQLIDFAYNSSDSIELSLCKENHSQLKKTVSKNSKYLEIEFNKGYRSFIYKSKNKYNLFQDKNKLSFIPKEFKQDTIYIETIDSTFTLTKDTLVFKPNNEDKQTKNFLNKVDVNGQTVEITFTHFHNIINIDSIFIKVNESKVNKTIIKMNENKWLIESKEKIDSALLEFRPKSLISSLGDTNKLEKFVFKKPLVEETENSISCLITVNYTNYFVELYTADGKVHERIKNQKDVLFNNLKPGKYFIRVLIDENNNGTWDGGNIKKRIKAEKVIHYGKEIELRENWEIKDIHIM